jgi:hypothetical protein
MIQALHGLVADVVEVVGSPAARAEGVAGMVFAPLFRHAASELPNAAVHREIADRLAPSLRALL